jgi:hypothetical protein
MIIRHRESNPTGNSLLHLIPEKFHETLCLVTVIGQVPRHVPGAVSLQGCCRRAHEGSYLSREMEWAATATDAGGGLRLRNARIAVQRA